MSDEMESSQPDDRESKHQHKGNAGKKAKPQTILQIFLGKDEDAQDQEKILEAIRSDPESWFRQFVQIQEEAAALKQRNDTLEQLNRKLAQQCDYLDGNIKELEQRSARLNKIKEDLLQERTENINEYNTLVKRFNELLDHLDRSTNLQKKVSRLKDDNEALVKECALLNERLQSLASTNVVLKKERDEFDGRVNGLLSELANYRRNKTGTYVSSDAQQSHLLLQDFRNFKSQDFQAISNQLFDYLSDKDSSLKQNRKVEIARIKSILSKEILKESEALARIRVRSLIEETLNALHTLPVPDNLRSSIAEGVKQLLSDNPALSSFTKTDGEVVDNIKSSIDCITIALGMEDAITLPAELCNNLKRFFSQATELVRKMASTEPPGELVTEKQDALFDPNKHEALMGYSEEGKVHSTVYPGYRVDSRVLEKPVVTTY